MDIKEQIGTKIRELRKNIGLTQEELAERVDLESGYISQIERGWKYPSLRTLVKIAQVLEVNVDYFVKTDTDINLHQEMKAFSKSDLLIKKLVLLLKDKDPEDIKFIITLTKRFLARVYKYSGGRKEEKRDTL
ncbi:MAG: helix-turn-helix transcriptional regulator [Nitrospirota bacterium]